MNRMSNCKYFAFESKAKYFKLFNSFNWKVRIVRISYHPVMKTFKKYIINFRPVV